MENFSTVVTLCIVGAISLLLSLSVMFASRPRASWQTFQRLRSQQRLGLFMLAALPLNLAAICLAAPWLANQMDTPAFSIANLLYSAGFVGSWVVIGLTSLVGRQ